MAIFLVSSRAMNSKPQETVWFIGRMKYQEAAVEVSTRRRWREERSLTGGATELYNVTIQVVTLLFGLIQRRLGVKNNYHVSVSAVAI